MSDIYINQQGLKPPTHIETQGCHGHNVSIAAGGKDIVMGIVVVVMV